MKYRTLLAPVLALTLAVAGCSAPDDSDDQAVMPIEDDNPFFAPSPLPYGLPPFDQIEDQHFGPALERGMAEQMAEIETIAENPEPPSFENTVVAMERSGRLLARVNRVFSNLAGAHTNDTIRAVEREFAPRLAAHQDAIRLNPALFARIDSLYRTRDGLELNAESQRLLERYHEDFVRAGAALSDADKSRLREINAELARLGTEFSQNVLAEVNDSAVLVEDRNALNGLSDSAIAAAAAAAEEAGFEGKYLITLTNTSGQPPLADLEERTLRERIHRASLDRGSRGGDYDNRGIVADVIRLRAEQARLLGFPTYADYVLDIQTAGSVETVNDLLGRLAPIALGNARREAADLQTMIDSEEQPFELASWDWDYYAEKVRRARFEIDEAELRPYFELDSVLENGVFHSANRLFGVTFKERPDLPAYHPDVRVFEVFDADGSALGLMLGDFYARPSKRGGAWMNSYVVRSGLLGGHPVTGNHLNVQKPPEGEPTLLTFSEVNTLFHEFGHVLHGLFSDVHYPRFAATAVPRDFVEYPSQVYEMWAEWPEVLANYARHHQTGEPIPQALLERLLAARQFNEGFRTLEYLAASLLDQAWHQIGPEEVPDADGVLDFEAVALRTAGVDYPPVPPRYRTTYFSHIMGGYAAGYYSYIWSEVLDADSVEWFKEQGGLTRENGERFRRTILASGGSRDAMDLYQEFAGREPALEPLMIRRGLITDDESGDDRPGAASGE